MKLNFISLIRPILCVPIIRILRATIGTYLKKSFLCAPICANFEISILKRNDIFRIDLIIVAIIRSTRYSQKKIDNSTSWPWANPPLLFLINHTTNLLERPHKPNIFSTLVPNLQAHQQLKKVLHHFSAIKGECEKLGPCCGRISTTKNAFTHH